MKKIISSMLICCLFLLPVMPVIATENIKDNTVKVGYVVDT